MRFPSQLVLGLAAAFSIITVSPAATAGSREQALYAHQAPQSETLPDGGVAVPLIEAARHPTVEVTIHGRPYRFQVETGAWFNSISSRAAGELGLQPSRDGDVAIDSLKIGDAELSHLRADVVDHPPGDVDGQLGLPAFAHLLLTVDFPHRQLRLARGSLPAANGQDILALTAVGPLWGVPITVGGKSFTGFIDTQSGDGLAMAPQLARTVVFTAKPVATGRAHGPAIGDVNVTTARLDGDVAFGGYRVQKPLVASFPLEIRFPGFGVLMGPPLLSNFVLTLDQKDRLARFERAGDPVIAPPPPLVRMGMVIADGPDGSLHVLAVQPGGGAASAGLKEGDEILAVNGARTVGEPPNLTSVQGASVRFLMRRDGVERNIDVRPTVLVP